MRPTHQSTGVSRRGFIQGVSVSALAVGSAGLLSACGTSGAKVNKSECRSEDLSSKEKAINFSNWIGYVDPVKAKDTSTLEKFEQQTGISVDYQQDVNDNEQFYAKVSPQLQSCKSTGRDVFVLTDWMAARMIDLGWLQKLDHSKMPNVDANLIDFLKAPDPVDSFETLLTRPDLKGKVELLTEMRDTMLFMLLMQGDDPEDFTDTQYADAISALDGFVQNGQIRRFAGNDY
ncbi:MAG: spermidine/putrescine ABC transporter substrate-binding protein, partial [Nocardioidaceae bacterium]